MNGIVSCIHTLNDIPQMTTGSSILGFLSKPYAIGIYLAILMFLVAVLAGAVLIALHLIRKDAEKIQENVAYNTANGEKRLTIFHFMVKYKVENLSTKK